MASCLINTIRACVTTLALEDLGVSPRGLTGVTFPPVVVFGCVVYLTVSVLLGKTIIRK
jgi:hypothetical protein